MYKKLQLKNLSLERIANFDPLTQLFNRRSMNQYLEQAKQLAETDRQQNFCLIMCDIDNFKGVNDTYGHAAGDEVLIQVAQLLSEGIREEDCVCRWGGEEMLLLVHSNKKDAMIIAERIRSEIEQLVIFHEKTKLSVTITMGVVQYKPGDTITSVIERADKRLYYGKNHGKNQVVAN